MTLTAPLYFDHASTTPVRTEVFEAMKPYFESFYGNPSSRAHAFGWKAEAAVEHARHLIAKVLHARDAEVVFTSGATESNYWALEGSLSWMRERLAEKGFPSDRKPHVLISAVEHSSMLETVNKMHALGLIEFDLVPVDEKARLKIDSLQKLIRPETLFVSVQAGNNEVSTLQPLHAIGILAQQHGFLFHSDAVQVFGKLSLHPADLGIDLLSFSAHKNGGPKGIGALYVRKKKGFALKPLFVGGGQENDLRAGTQNVPAIVGFGKMAEMALVQGEVETSRIRGYRETLWALLKARLPGLERIGQAEDSLPHILSVRMPRVEASPLFSLIRELAVSSGSACASHSTDSSHVLMAMGYTEKEAKQAIRFSLGHSTESSDLPRATEIFASAVEEALKMNPILDSLEWEAEDTSTEKTKC